MGDETLEDISQLQDAEDFVFVGLADGSWVQVYGDGVVRLTTFEAEVTVNLFADLRPADD